MQLFYFGVSPGSAEPVVDMDHMVAKAYLLIACFLCNIFAKNYQNWLMYV